MCNFLQSTFSPVREIRRYSFYLLCRNLKNQIKNIQSNFIGGKGRLPSESHHQAPGQTNFGNLAAILRDHALRCAKDDDSVEYVLAMTRCSTFTKTTGAASASADADMAAYRAYVNSYVDPTIFFHVSGGAQVECVIPGYRPEDPDNVGSAILIRYILEAVESSEEFASQESRIQKLSTEKASSILKEICRFINTMLIESQPISYEKLLHIPLMNLLDSIGMQLLRNRIQDLLKCELPLSFLFQYSTLSSINEFMTESIEACSDEGKSMKCQFIPPANLLSHGNCTLFRLV